MWLPLIGEYLVVSDPLQPADAIVVLSGGGPERVVQGAELFNEGYASWFVVTNYSLRLPGLRVRYSDLMKTEAESHGIPEDRILTAPHTVKTTYEEAKAIKELANSQGFKSLIVVTDR
ncbi:MAG TPA: YdcF family protein, partial [Aggregatilineaceae bacterium]|nr:YdcF family protein [Aggregatilineaceae bacterium]